MSVLVYLDWQGEPKWVGTIHSAERGQTITFQYAAEWLGRHDAFSIDPTSLPLQQGAFHSATLFGAIQDCGPDRWGRVVIERAVRKGIPALGLASGGFLADLQASPLGLAIFFQNSVECAGDYSAPEDL